MAYNPNNPNGQAVKANSSPVVLATEQETILGDSLGNLQQIVSETQDTSNRVGDSTSAAAATDTSNANINSLFKRLLQRITTLITNTGSPLQAGGSVTANAGTNLNTSALATESDRKSVV